MMDLREKGANRGKPVVSDREDEGTADEALPGDLMAQPPVTLSKTDQF